MVVAFDADGVRKGGAVAILEPATRKAGRPIGSSAQSNFRSRQAQAGQIKLAVFGVSQEAGVRDHDRADGTQPRDDLSRLGKASHMGIAGGKIAIWHGEAGILLDREE